MIDVPQIHISIRAKNPVRDELKIVAGRNIFQPGGVPFLVQTA